MNTLTDEVRNRRTNALKALDKAKAIENNVDKVRLILNNNTNVFISRKRLNELGAEKILKKYEGRTKFGYFTQRADFNPIN